MRSWNAYSISDLVRRSQKLRNIYGIPDLVRCSQELHRSSYTVRSTPVFLPYAHSHGHSAAFMHSWNNYSIPDLVRRSQKLHRSSGTPTAYLTLSDVPSSSQELHRSSYTVRSAPVFRPYAYSHGHSATFARTFSYIHTDIWLHSHGHLAAFTRTFGCIHAFLE